MQINSNYVNSTITSNLTDYRPSFKSLKKIEQFYGQKIRENKDIPTVQIEVFLDKFTGLPSLWNEIQNDQNQGVIISKDTLYQALGTTSQILAGVAGGAVSAPILLTAMSSVPAIIPAIGAVTIAGYCAYQMKKLVDHWR